MRRIILASFLLTSFVNFSQIDYSKLIIGRNTGTKTFYDGTTARIFGFSETLGESIDLPGPTIVFNQGDSIEIDFWNVSQGAPHTIHLHGLDVDQANDGVPALSFDVLHMDHGFYRFKAPHAGTYLYHCHVASTIHVQAGMYGAIIVRPSDGSTTTTWDGGETYDRDFLWTSSEADTNWHKDAILNHPYDTVNPQPIMVPDVYNPQYYLINGQSDTQLTDPSGYYIAGENEKVYLRLTNIGYYGIRYIFPAAINARTISSDGRPLPTEFLSDTLEIFPGERYETMVQLGSDPLYPVTVEYFNLNTQQLASTQTVTIRTSGVGLNEALADQLDIFPNPSGSGVFTAGSAFDLPYIVYNAVGEQVLQSQAQIVDLSDQPSGLYVLRYRGVAKKLLIY